MDFRLRFGVRFGLGAVYVDLGFGIWGLGFGWGRGLDGKRQDGVRGVLG